MENRKIFLRIVLITVFAIMAVSCSKSARGNSESTNSGGKSFNSADDLKTYLDKQPANSPDKPVKIAMKLNEPMFEKIKEVINTAGKYVSLDLSGSPTTTIPDEAFKGCKLLAGIIIPDSVTEIGEEAFYDCSSLTSVIIPDGITYIWGGTFAYCESLASVKIPDSVTEIWRLAFVGCKSLTGVTIPAGVTEIGDQAFNYCDSLTSITFQGTLDNLIRPFYGDLRAKYLAGGVGTYTTTAPVDEEAKWTKQ